MEKQKFYVVWKGRKPGIYTSWEACQEQIKGFHDAQFKSFKNKQAAEIAFSRPYEKVDFNDKRAIVSNLYLNFKNDIEWDSVCVDAACSGNPGPIEYQGVNLQSQQVIFKAGPYEDGTNNIGEFLAIVHALALFEQHNTPNRTIYSDSSVAIGWVAKKKCNSKLAHTNKNGKLFEIIARAESWLRTHTIKTKILKWNTEIWGEIPADFSRK